MLVELARTATLVAAAERLEILANALFADVHAIEGDLDRAVVGEQIRDLVPQAAVEVVAVGVLQALDGVHVLDQRLALLERHDTRIQRRETPGIGAGRSRTAGGGADRDEQRADGCFELDDHDSPCGQLRLRRPPQDCPPQGPGLQSGTGWRSMKPRATRAISSNALPWSPRARFSTR